MNDKIIFPHSEEKKKDDAHWLTRVIEDGLKLRAELSAKGTREFYYKLLSWVCYCKVFKIPISNEEDVNQLLKETWDKIRDKQLAWIHRDTNRCNTCKVKKVNCSEKR